MQFICAQIFTNVILRQSTSCQVIGCCFIIVCGFLLGIKEEDKSIEGASLSIVGVVSGILASVCVALYAIFTKKILPMVGNNIWRLQFYNNLIAVMLLSVAVLFWERHLLSEFQFWFSPYFWFLMLMVSIFGIAIGYVTSLQIQVCNYIKWGLLY